MCLMTEEHLNLHTTGLSSSTLSYCPFITTQCSHTDVRFDRSQSTQHTLETFGQAQVERKAGQGLKGNREWKGEATGREAVSTARGSDGSSKKKRTEKMIAKAQSRQRSKKR